ncbi:MAG: class I SAM-dependent methyltransferase [Peptococcaceae bacterium]|nr:class I SAM-dependent methyltransferase [Peptococcaceae bacterium]
MKKLNQELNQLHVKKALDIATRTGDFALTLARELGSYEEIIAIDIDEKAMEKGKAKLGEIPGLGFEKQDGCHTAYPDHSFDLIGISNSLHHFPDLEALFAEIRRLLAPGGTLVVNEMPRDRQEGAAASHFLLHYWDCSVDTARGVFHRKNYSCAEILDILKKHGVVVEKDFLDQPTDPQLVPPLIKRVESMEEKLEKVKDAPDYQAMKAEMDKVRQHYNRYGMARANQYVVFGKME